MMDSSLADGRSVAEYVKAHPERFPEISEILSTYKKSFLWTLTPFFSYESLMEQNYLFFRWNNNFSGNNEAVRAKAIKSTIEEY